jgi:hypothetical protein
VAFTVVVFHNDAISTSLYEVRVLNDRCDPDTGTSILATRVFGLRFQYCLFCCLQSHLCPFSLFIVTVMHGLPPRLTVLDIRYDYQTCQQKDPVLTRMIASNLTFLTTHFIVYMLRFLAPWQDEIRDHGRSDWRWHMPLRRMPI